MPSLSNPFLHFSFDLNSGRWTLYPQKQEAPFIEQAGFGAAYSVRGKPARWGGGFVDLRAERPPEIESAHGRLNLLRVTGRAPSLQKEPSTLRWDIEFALPEGRPFLLWRATARNLGAQPVSLETIDLAVVGPPMSPKRLWVNPLQIFLGLGRGGDTSSGALRLHPSPGRLAFFSNGYQSWTFTGALRAAHRQPSSLFGPLGEPKRVNLRTPNVRRRGHFVGDMFGAMGDLDHRTGLLAGFISQREQFGHVEVLLDALAPSLRLTAQCDGVALAPGEERATDWAYLQFIELDHPDPLGEYTAAVAREHDAHVPASTPVGWCSWYYYFDKVRETDITGNLEAIVEDHDRLPLDFVQLDDGYQAQVGDWFETNDKFPHGLAWLAKEIRERGRTPGLWLAPYLVRSDARLRRDHPDWLLRADWGPFANAGYNWFRWCYALDPTHPEVREHIRRLISTAVNEWGLPYLKLDFLYAAALPARRHDPALTRAQAMRLALADIREAAGPNTFLLGCGCPLGSAVGIVDGMRIGTDVAPDWEPQLFTPRLAPLLRNETDFVAARNAIRNTINRAPLHRRWWLNDPDCLLVRDADSRLTEAEVRSLATVIALSGGMFLLSDDMTRLSAERRKYVAPLLPVLNTVARAVNWMDSVMPDTLVLPLSGPAGDWLAAGIFNWDDAPRDRTLDLKTLGLPADGDCFVSDFWEGKHALLASGQPLTFSAISPHGSHLFAVRRIASGPQLVASSFHFSQGAEIIAWETAGRSLRFRIELGRVADGEVRLALPGAPQSASVDGQTVAARNLGGGVYSLHFNVPRAADVEITW
jgi:alpha-galactosidase